MKIAMFSDSFFPIMGGREMVIDNCVRILNKKNYCFVCAPKIKGEIKGKTDSDLPYKVYRCNSIRVSKSEYLSTPNRKFKKQVESEKPDIIHCQTKYGLLNYAFKLRKKFHIPVVTTVHTNYPDVYKNTLPKLVAKIALRFIKSQLNKCDHIFTVSYKMKGRLEQMGVKTPIQVVRNGIHKPTTTKPKEEAISFVNEKFGIDKDAFVICYVGRVVDVKNIPFQLETIKNLASRTEKKFLFLLVGDGPDRKKYEEYCKDNNLENYVKFIGAISDRDVLNSIYQRANLNYFASVADSDGLTIPESALFETPSLVIAGTAGAERINNLHNGFVEDHNEEKVENLLVDILENKYNLTEIGENAKKEIPADWSDIVGIFEEKYKEIIEKYKKNWHFCQFFLFFI